MFCWKLQTFNMECLDDAYADLRYYFTVYLSKHDLNWMHLQFIQGSSGGSSLTTGHTRHNFIARINLCLCIIDCSWSSNGLYFDFERLALVRLHLSVIR